MVTAEPGALGASAHARPLEGRRVLVVDDEEDVRTFILTVLADAGAQVLEAEDGAQALRLAKDKAPDLITLDLSMPGTDGIEVFRALRQSPSTGRIPVCIVTGRPEFRQLIYERPVAPPEGYMTKPFDEGELVSTIRRIIWMAERGRSQDH